MASGRVFRLIISMTKLLCVYCASSAKLDPKYYAAGESLGRSLVAHGWGLIYGGGNAGVMGAVARSVKSAGGVVIGVIPDFMQERELAFTAANELLVVSTMRERKRIMEERADAFVALPGGIGTLEELSEILVSRSLNRHAKPVVLVNQDGFYDDLLRFFDRMTRENFKSPGLARVMRVVTEIEAVWSALKRPDGFEVDALWQ